jgi:hypothetical protein
MPRVSFKVERQRSSQLDQPKRVVRAGVLPNGARLYRSRCLHGHRTKRLAATAYKDAAVTSPKRRGNYLPNGFQPGTF